MTWQITKNNLESIGGQLTLNHPERGTITLSPQREPGFLTSKFVRLSFVLKEFTTNSQADDYLKKLDPELRVLMGWGSIVEIDQSNPANNITKLEISISYLNQRQVQILTRYLRSNQIGLSEDFVSLILKKTSFRELCPSEMKFYTDLKQISSDNFERLFQTAQALMKPPGANRLMLELFDYLDRLATACLDKGLLQQASISYTALTKYPDNGYSPNAGYMYMKLQEHIRSDGIDETDDDHERLGKLISKTVEVLSNVNADLPSLKLLAERIMKYADVEFGELANLNMAEPVAFLKLLLKIGDNNFKNKQENLELKMKLKAYESQAPNLSLRDKTPRSMTLKFDSLNLGENSTSLSFDTVKSRANDTRP